MNVTFEDIYQFITILYNIEGRYNIFIASLREDEHIPAGKDLTNPTIWI